MSDDLDAELASVYQESTKEEVTAVEPTSEVSESPESEGAAEVEITDQEESGESETEQDAKPAIQPPSSWSAESKEKFKTFPPEAQEEILRREKERDDFVFRKSQEIEQERRQYKAIDSAFEGFESELQKVGLDKPQAIKELVSLYRYAQDNPIGYINHVAQSYGIDLKALANGEIDPREIQLSQQRSELSEIKQMLNELRSSKEASETGSLTSLVNEFGTKPENKHFEKVRGVMGKLIQAGEAEGLQDAYEKAIWLDPDVRAEVLKEQEAERVRVEKEKAAKAKKLAGSGLSSEELSRSSKSSSLDDDLAKVYQKSMGGKAA